MFKRTDWQQTDGTVASVEPYSTRTGTWYKLVFTYKVNDEWYGGSYNTDEAYERGDSFPVDYDPANPERNKQALEMRTKAWVVGIVLAGVALAILLNLLAKSR